MFCVLERRDVQMLEKGEERLFVREWGEAVRSRTAGHCSLENGESWRTGRHSDVGDRGEGVHSRMARHCSLENEKMFCIPERVESENGETFRCWRKGRCCSFENGETFWLENEKTFYVQERGESENGETFCVRERGDVGERGGDVFENGQMLERGDVLRWRRDRSGNGRRPTLERRPVGEWETSYVGEETSRGTGDVYVGEETGRGTGEPTWRMGRHPKTLGSPMASVGLDSC
ncbi:hypothetical protein BDN72DRAFT_865800 [Pluteus cervinus]|uniref:Uncharacterized protein n=1 Tax=Pluteus cervinus TaxID=181527 RepID=A0ACD2ZYU5_9AGAR|nr:hypothetical protein BDN72DRAFT_865800 [Pluteus cervinus]